MAVSLTTYKTPGVYVQEIRKLPPSIAQVDTAIPVFIGYTQKADQDEVEDLQMKPTRIRSLPEYENLFGTTNAEDLELRINTDSATGRRSIKVDLKDKAGFKAQIQYYMHYALQMFYANGGGECFIISVGDLTDRIDENRLIEGMMLLKEQLDPTLILFPDAVSLDSGSFRPLMQRGMQFCADPKFTNFFLVMDVPHLVEVKNTDGGVQNIDSDIEDFRQIAGSLEEFKYGTAYYPYLISSIPYERDPAQITVVENTIDRETLTERIARRTTLADSLPPGPEKDAVNALLAEANAQKVLEDASIAQQALIQAEEDKLEPLFLNQETRDDIERAMNAAIDEGKDNEGVKTAASEAADPVPAIKAVVDGVDVTAEPSEVAARDAILAAVDASLDDGGDDIATQIQKAQQAVQAAKNAALGAFQAAADEGIYTHATLDIISQVDNGLYNEILNVLDSEKGAVIMPPSSAMAGAYARVDNARGVFKSPANIGLGAVIRPYKKISDEVQDSLNVDTKAGKSINVIRSFIGRGTLVWGARTLAGNDREWRYVSVRRFFNMVEESVKRALLGFVFEANNANTWASVRASIESFLETQWRAGALLGNSPEDAFFVRVGMPETFTEAEMLDGFMVVEIGMAVVRPAEFIVLKFMHKFELGQS